MKTAVRALMLGLIAVLLPFASIAACAAQAETDSPQAAVDALLAADRAYSSASVKTDMVAGLSAMFDVDIVMPRPPDRIVRGREAAVASLHENADNARSKVEWVPVRGGISADGHQGFTFGYMMLTKPDKTKVPLKYLAYWIKRPEGWRVAAYKYVRRPEGPVSMDMIAPSLPRRNTAFDPGGPARFAAGLAAAEKAFSDEAQTVGLATAFARNGSADAMNMGAKPGFAIGAETISRELFGEPKPGSPLEWSSDDVLVASSGDLGVSWGRIRFKQPPAGGPAAASFFTVWRRASPDEPWRYIAE